MTLKLLLRIKKCIFIKIDINLLIPMLRFENYMVLKIENIKMVWIMI